MVALERLPGRRSRSAALSRALIGATPLALDAIDSSSSFQDLTKASAPSLLEPRRERVDVDPGLLELRQQTCSASPPSAGSGVADLAVVGEGVQGRCSGIVLIVNGAAKRLDVEDVGGVRVLGPGARPEQPLRARALVRSRCQRSESSSSR